MNKFLLAGAALLSFTVLAVTSDAAFAKGGGDNPTNVTIDPSGNDVDANITGGSVGVSGAVEIENDLGNPLPVDTGASAREPMVFRKSTAVAEFGDVISVNILDSPIAADQMFVLEHVSIRLSCDSAACDGVTARIDTATPISQGGALIQASSEFFPQPAGVNAVGNSVYIVSQPVRMYIGGNTIQFNASAAPNTVDLTASINLLGYLIPVDEPSLAP